MYELQRKEKDQKRTQERLTKKHQDSRCLFTLNLEQFGSLAQKKTV